MREIAPIHEAMTLFKLHAILACQDESLSSRSPPIQLRSSSAIVPGHGKKALKV
jgi:hypothetical protein